MSGKREEDLAKRLAAYNGFLDEVVTESGYWLLGEREDPERVQALYEGVADPSTLTFRRRRRA